jgi:hypothetical protein
MSDTAPTSTTDTAPTDTEQPKPDTGTETPDHAAEAEKWKALARKHEAQAKANAKAAKELEEFRKQSMTDTEKAIEEARTEGRRQALTEAGSRIAAAEVRAAATGRMTAEQLDTLVDNVNLTRFVTDTGDVDRDAVTKFVDGIAPQPAEKPFDLGQGARDPNGAPKSPERQIARQLFNSQ